MKDTFVVIIVLEDTTIPLSVVLHPIHLSRNNPSMPTFPKFMKELLKNETIIEEETMKLESSWSAII